MIVNADVSVTGVVAVEIEVGDDTSDDQIKSELEWLASMEVSGLESAQFSVGTWVLSEVRGKR